MFWRVHDTDTFPPTLCRRGSVNLMARTTTVSLFDKKNKLRVLKTDSRWVVFRDATVTIDDDELDVVVEMRVINTAGVPECRELRLIARDDGRPITNETSRVPVRSLLEEAAHAIVLKANGDGNFEPITSDREARAFIAARDSERRNARRRITDEDLQRVAEVYRMAKAEGRPTGRAIEVEMHLTPDQARQWVGKAKRAGFLEVSK